MTDEIKLDDSFHRYIVVDGIPIVGQDKLPKLTKVLDLQFKKHGDVVSLYVPETPEGQSKGLCFIEYSKKEEADAAVAKMNNHQLDKAHTLVVSHYEAVKKIWTIPQTYEEPQLQPYVGKENLQSWLLDERAMDQYVTRYSDLTEVVWNDLKTGEEPESVLRRVQDAQDRNAYVAWSPKGSYLLTIHAAGSVALWGGQRWAKFARFLHPGVKLVEFSPCERYLVTASPQFQDNDNPKDPQCIIVWDIRTQRKLRGFTSGKNTSTWPVFKWSHDGNYIARVIENAIAVHCVPSMDLLDKKSIKAPGVKEFSWSPTDLLISYFLPAVDTRAPTLFIVDIPTKKERRSKVLFDATECKLNWHPQGTYLCLKIDRQKKKTTIQGFEIFRIREKDIPVELLEFKETVHSFAWEPHGNRFAIAHGEPPRLDISFYVVEKSIRLLKTLDKKPANQLIWSPKGKYIVLGGVGANSTGVLEFFNVDDMESMEIVEHFNTSGVEWDPTGRYVTSVVSAWRHNIENGYNMYNFQGKELKKVLKDKFFQLLWRPRPPSPLSEDQLEGMKKNMEGLSKRYKEADQMKKREEREKRAQKRINIKKEFEEYIRLKKEEYAESTREFEREALDGEPYEDEKNVYYIEKQVEEVQDVEETILED